MDEDEDEEGRLRNRQTNTSESGSRQTEPRQTDPRETGPRQTDPRQTDPRETGPRQTDPRQTDPRQTGPRQAGPRQTDPRPTDPRQPDPPQSKPRGPLREWLSKLPHEVNWKRIWKPLLGEFLGCFLINFCACGAAIASDNWGHTLTPIVPSTYSYGDTYQVSVSLAFGLTTATMFGMFQHVSGGHANPAVTLAMMVGRKIYFFQGLIYIPVQFCGCLAGSGFLWAVMGKMNAGREDVFPTLLYRQHGLQVWQGFIWEIIISFVLVLMYFAVTDDDHPKFGFTAPLLIGGAVVINHMAALYATGASANPARSVGAAVVSLKFDDIWVYIVSPVLGAFIATAFYVVIMSHEKELQEVIGEGQP